MSRLISRPTRPGIAPEESTAVIIIVAIWVGLNLIPNSAGREINSGKIPEQAIPKPKELKYTVSSLLKNRVKRLVTPIMARIPTETLIFLDAVTEVREATMNLKKVLVPQNIVPNRVASFLSEISAKTA